MGQRVNPVLFRAGVSTFWGSANYPTNKRLSSMVDTNFIFSIVSFFLKKNKIKLYSFKCNISNNIFYIYIMFLKNKLVPKSKFTIKKNKTKFKFKKELSALNPLKTNKLKFSFFNS